MSVAFSRADAALLCFDDEQVMALRAAQAMGLPLSVLERHRFPDGELRLRLPDPLPPRVVIWRGLQQPNENPSSSTARMKSSDTRTLLFEFWKNTDEYAGPANEPS